MFVADSSTKVPKMKDLKQPINLRSAKILIVEAYRDYPIVSRYFFSKMAVYFYTKNPGVSKIAFDPSW